MRFAAFFEASYKYLYNAGVYTKEIVAGYVSKTIDAAAYKRITGDEYAAPSA